jgi:NADP-reducing hydrogenase subunit HndD
MRENLKITINGKEVQVPEGTTIIKAAKQEGIIIPSICYHEYCTSNALCRICVVEVEGARTLIPACIAIVSEGMVVSTQTERVCKARRTILEMLASTLDLSEAPEIMALIHVYKANTDRFPMSERRQLPFIDDNPMYIRDYTKCLLCWRCVQVCAEDAQYTHAINFYHRGYDTSIGTFYNKPILETTCVFCGQCVGVCPSGALKSKKEFLLEVGYSPDEIMELTREQRKQRTRKEKADGGGK